MPDLILGPDTGTDVVFGGTPLLSALHGDAAVEASLTKAAYRYATPLGQAVVRGSLHASPSMLRAQTVLGEAVVSGPALRASWLWGPSVGVAAVGQREVTIAGRALVAGYVGKPIRPVGQRSVGVASAKATLSTAYKYMLGEARGLASVRSTPPSVVRDEVVVTAVAAVASRLGLKRSVTGAAVGAAAARMTPPVGHQALASGSAGSAEVAGESLFFVILLNGRVVAQAVVTLPLISTGIRTDFNVGTSAVTGGLPTARPVLARPVVGTSAVRASLYRQLPVTLGIPTGTGTILAEGSLSALGMRGGSGELTDVGSLAADGAKLADGGGGSITGVASLSAAAVRAGGGTIPGDGSLGAVGARAGSGTIADTGSLSAAGARVSGGTIAGEGSLSATGARASAAASSRAPHSCARAGRIWAAGPSPAPGRCGLARPTSAAEPLPAPGRSRRPGAASVAARSRASGPCPPAA